MQNLQPNDSAKFSSVNLPTLPQTLIRLMEICNDPESNIVKKLTSDLAGQISYCTNKAGRTQFIRQLPVKGAPAR